MQKTTRTIYFFTAAVLLLGSCSNPNKELSAEEQAIADSISKVQQQQKVDSMKKKNPLLIMPPDSTYTGSYVDKYPNGINKFVGFYRLGQRHGQWMAFYPNGTQWSEMHYDKGLRQGPNIAYFEDGKVRFSGFYKNDKQDSVWSYYDSIGNLAERVLFKNDRVIKRLPLK